MEYLHRYYEATPDCQLQVGVHKAPDCQLQVGVHKAPDCQLQVGVHMMYLILTLR